MFCAQENKAARAKVDSAMQKSSKVEYYLQKALAAVQAQESDLSSASQSLGGVGSVPSHTLSTKVTSCPAPA